MKSNKRDREDYSYLEGEEQNSVAMVIGGIVLLVIIVVLCAMIWKLFHPNDNSVKPGVGQNVQETANDTLKETGTGSEDTIKDSTEGTQSAEDAKAGEDSGDSGQNENGEQDSNVGQDGSGQDKAGQDSQGVMMTFEEVDDTVTAKEVTNLRSEPSTDRSDTVVTQLKNGQTAKRTGVNDAAGWSRLEYDGQVLYAATRLLTTDLSAGNDGQTGAASGSQSQSTSSADDTVTTSAGRVITFTDCDDYISAKIEVNLRLEPSTNEGNGSIHCRLMYGEKAHRTGYDEASGWSRVEYDGKVLYTVTSLIYVVEEQTQTQE